MLRFIRIGCFLLFTTVIIFPSYAGTYRSSTDQSIRLFYPALVHGYRTAGRDSNSLEDNSPPVSVNTTKLLLVSGTLLASMVVIHVYQQNGWWKDNRSSFHFREDLKYGLHVDKIGHFWGAAVLTEVISLSLRWADMKEEPALLCGAGGSLLFQTYVEVQDGFSTWGFDRVDFLSDVAGAAWPIARYYIPPLQNVDFKFSYLPSPLIHQPGGAGFRGQQHLIMDDYEGQTFWLSLNLNDVLPKTIEPYWPDFLRLAIGYGARDIATQDNAYRVYFLALDYDMSKIIPSSTSFLRSVNKILNYIHLPAPAVQLFPTTIWYGLYF
jgi:hypothetical protein